MTVETQDRSTAVSFLLSPLSLLGYAANLRSVVADAATTALATGKNRRKEHWLPRWAPSLRFASTSSQCHPPGVFYVQRCRRAYRVEDAR